MATLASAQQSVAEQLADRIVRSGSNPDSVWQVNGSAGTGKTTVLQRTAEILRDRGIVAILVSAPEGELDAGAIGLVRMASGLQAASLINGQVDQLRDPQVRSADKLTKVQSWVEDHHRDVVLLCDEPTTWYDARSETFPNASDRLARDLVAWVSQAAPCRRVIGGLHPALDRPPQSFTAPRIEEAGKFLGDASLWGKLAPRAEALATRASELREATPLRLHLLVALASVKSSEWVIERLKWFETEERLVDALLDELAARQDGPSVCRDLTRLSTVRGPVPPKLLDPLDAGPDPSRRDLIVRCLTVGEGVQAELHPLVRRRVRARGMGPPWKLSPDERAQIHEDLAKHYAMVAQAALCPLTDQMEEFHHGFQTGDEAHPVRGSHFFPEQLRAAGRYLSYVAHRHEDAVAVFNLCLSHDERDDYAHHYRAYNLDWQAEKPEDVEKGYRRALELNPWHPWWWSRWISYLITRGRAEDAWREWHRALDVLNVSGLDTPRETAIVGSLHRWVARWLLHWSQLDFAENVLDTVAPSYRASDSSLRALDRLLRALREAERAFAVFPLNVPPECWWTPEPHLEFPREWNGQPMTQWRPARVQTVEIGLVELVVGEPPSGPSVAPRHGFFTFGIEEVKAAGFDPAGLRPGQFLELSFYGNDGAMLIRAHDDAPWRDRDLLPLYPPPNRWVRRLTTG